MKSRLLIAGNSQVGNISFLRNLQNSIGKKTHRSSTNDLTLHLKTKYYIADVEIDVYTLPNDLSEDFHRQMTERMYEGIIFVINRNDRSTFTNVRDAMQAIAELYPLSISLLIVYSAIEFSGQSVCTAAELESFCLDHSMELIDMDDDDRRRKEDDTECKGLARVVEALESTMWKSMQKIEPNAMSTVSQSDGIDTDAVNGDMDAFDSLLSQVRQIRENGSKVTHEARRREAEEVAIRLWELIGHDED
ncbi:hypothetical protein ABG067_005556 [Albugo candida]